MEGMDQPHPALDRPPHRNASRHHLLGSGLAALGGVALAVQSRINGDLGSRLRDGVASATISFSSGLLVLCVLIAVRPAARRGLGQLGAALRAGRLRPWQCLGGVAGAYLVISQGVAVAPLGVAVFTVASVAGQSVSGLVVDRLGIGPGGPRPLTGFRVAGAALAVVAVTISVGNRFGDPSSIGLAALPALAGVGSAWQQAFNGQVRAVTQHTLTATAVNFLVGTAVLLLALGVDFAIRGLPTGTLPGAPWFYLGGILGIVFITIAVAVVRYVGVLLLALSMIAGQLVAAVVLDLFAPEAKNRPGPTTVIGAALTFVAIGIAVARRPHR
jgi:transporter family-2 protein